MAEGCDWQGHNRDFQPPGVLLSDIAKDAATLPSTTPPPHHPHTLLVVLLAHLVVMLESKMIVEGPPGLCGVTGFIEGVVELLLASLP